MLPQEEQSSIVLLEELLLLFLLNCSGEDILREVLDDGTSQIYIYQCLVYHNV